VRWSFVHIPHNDTSMSIRFAACIISLALAKITVWHIWYNLQPLHMSTLPVVPNCFGEQKGHSCANPRGTLASPSTSTDWLPRLPGADSGIYIAVGTNSLFSQKHPCAAPGLCEATLHVCGGGGGIC
jgi:hypothetical protein